VPYDIAIRDGQIICNENPDFRHYWDTLREDPADDSGVRFLSALELRDIAREAAQIEMEDQELTHRMREVIEAQEQQDAEEFEGVLRGQERGLHTGVRPARQRCRPQVPFPWMPGLGYGAMVSMTLVEVFQLTWPLLDRLGVDTTNVALEWARNPLAVMGGVGSALAVTTGLILVWHLLISWAVELSRSWMTAGPFRSGARLAGLCFLSIFLLVGTVAIAALRHGSANDTSEVQGAMLGQDTSARTGSLVFVFMTVLMPAASAYLHHKIIQNAYWKQRRDIQALQARWDRDEEAKRQAGERRAHARELLQKKRARLEEQQAPLRARRMALAGRVLAAQKEWQEMLDAAQLATEAYSRSLRAALEQDKIYYLRAAYRAQAPPGGGSPPPQASDAAPYWQVVRPLLTDNRPKDES
jgi:hypothetical protein